MYNINDINYTYALISLSLNLFCNTDTCIEQILTDIRPPFVRSTSCFDIKPPIYNTWLYPYPKVLGSTLRWSGLYYSKTRYFGKDTLYSKHKL